MSIAKFGYWLFIGALFGNVFIWAFVPSLGMYTVSYLVLLGLAVVGLGLWVFFSFDRLVSWLKLRSTQFALSLGVMALMTFTILGFVNWLAVTKNVKKDLTANRLHTLSDQTRSVIDSLDEPVRVRVWTTNIALMSDGVDMQAFFENYREIGGDKLTIEIRNPNAHTAEAEADQVRRNNLIIVKAMKSGREARVETLSDVKAEEQLTNAIIQAAKGVKKIVCFVSGHGQPSLDNPEPQGLSLLKETLERSNYEPRELVLVNNDKVPADCELLAVVGPRNVPLEKEITLLKAYLETGAPMIALIGPRASKVWREFFKGYGVEVRQDILIDPYSPEAPTYVATGNYARDVRVTEGFNLLTLFPESSSISVPTESSDENLSIQPFVSSEARSYAKAGAVGSRIDVRPSGSDLRGPIPIAVLIEKSLESKEAAPEVSEAADVPDPMGEETQDDNEKKQRMILFSNDFFVVNGIVSKVGNSDLFMNSVSYLLQDAELIGIRPRDLRQTYLTLTAQNERQVTGIILIVAGLFMVFGIRAARRKAVVD